MAWAVWLSVLVSHVWLIASALLLVGLSPLPFYARRVLVPAFRASRAANPFIEVTDHELLIHQDMLFRETVRIPRHLIASVVIDTSRRPRWSSDRRRFGVTLPGTDTTRSATGWLYSYRGGTALPTLTLNLQAPNVLVLLSRPVQLPASSGRVIDHKLLLDLDDETTAGAHLANGRQEVPGFFLRATDPTRARQLFDQYGVLRDKLTPDDLPSSGLDFVMTGTTGGLEIAEPQVRTLARAVEFFTLFALFVAGGVFSLGATAVILLVLWWCYEVPMLAMSGRTPTKWLFGLRVVSVTDGSVRLGLRRASVRWMLVILTALSGGISKQFNVPSILGRLAPRLELATGMGAGTIEVTEREHRRLAQLPPKERREALKEATTAVHLTDPGVSRRTSFLVVAAVATFAVLMVGVRLAAPSEPHEICPACQPITTQHPYPPPGSIRTPPAGIPSAAPPRQPGERPTAATGAAPTGHGRNPGIDFGRELAEAKDHTAKARAQFRRHRR